MDTLPLDIARTLSARSAQELAEALLAFPATVRTRGEDYALASRVTEELAEDDGVRARVRGTRTYAVRWNWSDDGADPLCSCPSAPICKHAYAVGIRLLAAAVHEGVIGDPGIRRMLPLAWRHGPHERPQPPSSFLRPASELPRAPKAKPEVFEPRVRAIREAETMWLRQQAAAQLLWHFGMSHADVARLGLDHLLHDEDPDVRCWRLANAVAIANQGRVPRGLQAFLGRDDLANKAKEHKRQEVVEKLSKWAVSNERSQRHLRVLLGLAGDALEPRVTLQVRLTTSKLQDEPRSSNQLHQLAGDLRRDPQLLSPPQARLLRMLTEGELSYALPYSSQPAALANAQLNALMDRAAGSPFVQWSSDLPATLAARAGVTPGARVDFEGDDLRMVPECHLEEGELRLSLALVNGEGEARPMPDALLWASENTGLASHPTIALIGGAFHRVVEEPPRDVVRTLVEMHGLPLKREDGAMLDQLASRFATVAGALGQLTRVHDARPIVALDLRESDWLQVRVYALAGDPAWKPGGVLDESARLFEYTPRTGWERAADGAAPRPEVTLEHMQPPPADAIPAPGSEEEAAASAGEQEGAALSPWREVPEAARVAPALAWIEKLGVSRGDKRGPGGSPTLEPDGHTGWWLRLNARTAMALEECWAERPAGVTWYGNREVQRLLEGSRTVRTRVSVVASGMDWLKVKAEWEAEGMALTEADLAKLRAAREGFVRLASGWVRREDAESQDAVAAAHADLGLEADGVEQQISAWQLAQVRAGSLDVLEEAGADEHTRANVTRIREAMAAFQGVPSAGTPAGLTATLRPYQQDGLDFLAWTSGMGLGAVLADDMGLGKTVQALAWLLEMRARDAAASGGPVAPSLVVCPASVVHNWEREAARFAPNLRVLALTSGRDRRARLGTAGDHDLVVTNYALLRRDAERWKELELHAVILDEAQNIKNPDAVVTKAAQSLRARHRLALTGTPLENRALDLWSILSFVNPGYLGARSRFVARYDRPDAPPHSRRLLSARLRPVLLRRLKEQVAQDLPPRIEERLDCEMTPGQRKLYLAELVRGRELVRTLGAGEQGIAKQKIVILALLTRLRQICCHPALAGGDRALGSGKFDALFELLEPILAEGRKVLVFSQFVECLKLIEEACRKREVPYHMLTGSTSTKERANVVQAFGDDPSPCVFLVSLKAGGTGLNLTAASDVVLFDPWWNPAVEAQAIDRTHRIGQTRSVTAYKLLTEGTIEERIFELQQRKAAMVKDVLGEDGFARALTRADLDYLLSD
ncbi:MAG: DEAD/DEAH box helicase [Candidatus Eisenbacteria bacterium]|uniref:DEAD/DEAH box helicase n=1 Tax=Eiseniibacteriota bacterium TaxID=2212470 RepID=A0A933SBX9_UNCEI|nr:DEAD/DEAH box helicase [Candidatus Eisenbacteria bacterium]